MWKKFVIFLYLHTNILSKQNLDAFLACGPFHWKFSLIGSMDSYGAVFSPQKVHRKPTDKIELHVKGLTIQRNMCDNLKTTARKNSHYC